jgi:hemolysin-activating ACP:hemolysin acyltransferase
LAQELFNKIKGVIDKIAPFFHILEDKSSILGRLFVFKRLITLKVTKSNEKELKE